MDRPPSPRPDASDGARSPVEPQAGSRTPPLLIAVIVVSSLIALALIALLVVLAVDNIGRSTEDRFKQVQFCLDHPNDPTCMPQGTGAP